jgi:hypothetical protein
MVVGGRGGSVRVGLIVVRVFGERVSHLGWSAINEREIDDRHVDIEPDWAR